MCDRSDLVLVLNCMGSWQRVLWKKQPYPDNYVPPNFLSGLRRNTNFRPYTYTHVVIASFMITQHISSIFIFLSIFIRLLNGTLDPRLLVLISVVCFIVGYLLWEVLLSQFEGIKGETRAKTVKSSVLIFLALVALSPVLRTLTAATSSDSIWALSACLFGLNIILADYGSSRPRGRHQEKLTSVLSINAAISASVVLASRLSTNVAVFSLMLFSIQSFALFPLLRIQMQVHSPSIRLLVTAILALTSLYYIKRTSHTVAFILLTTFLIITFIIPGVLVWAQKYKNEIRGPWDVAVPILVHK